MNRLKLAVHEDSRMSVFIEQRYQVLLNNLQTSQFLKGTKSTIS